MTRRWALATVVVSLVLGVGSAMAFFTGPSAGAGTLAPLTDPDSAPADVDAEALAAGGVATAASAGAPVGRDTAVAQPDGRQPGTGTAEDRDGGGGGEADGVVSGAVAVRSARIDDVARDGDTVVPVRLELPQVGIDAAIDAVGVDPDGTMTVPEQVSRVGWYRYGPAPGDDVGSAVIAGHVDSHELGPGAFFPLSRVEPGAEITVTLSDGSTVVYDVTGRERIDKEALPTDDIFRRSGPGVLTLVTCGGAFDSDRFHYEDNIVVVAVERG